MEIWPEITLLLSQSHKYGLSSNFRSKTLSLRKVENKQANFSNIEIFETSSLTYIHIYISFNLLLNNFKNKITGYHVNEKLVSLSPIIVPLSLRNCSVKLERKLVR